MISRKQLEEALQCPICLDPYTNPKTLPCGHVLCCSCLIGLVRHGDTTIQCPPCRSVHLLPPGGATSFPDIFLVKDLLTTLPLERACQDCGTIEGSTSVCKHCGQDLCVECRVAHATLSHEVRASLKAVKYLESSVKVIKEKKVQILSSEEELKQELVRVKDIFTEMVTRIKDRENVVTEFVKKELEIYKMLSPVCEGESTLSDLHRDLSEKISQCKTGKSLRDLRTLVSVTESVIQSLLSPDGDHCRFVGDHQMVMALSDFGTIRRGRFEVDIVNDVVCEGMNKAQFDACQTQNVDSTESDISKIPYQAASPTCDNSRVDGADDERKFMMDSRDSRPSTGVQATYPDVTEISASKADEGFVDATGSKSKPEMSGTSSFGEVQSSQISIKLNNLNKGCGDTEASGAKIDARMSTLESAQISENKAKGASDAIKAGIGVTWAAIKSTQILDNKAQDVSDASRMSNKAYIDTQDFDQVKSAQISEIHLAKDASISLSQTEGSDSGMSPAKSGACSSCSIDPQRHLPRNVDYQAKQSSHVTVIAGSDKPSYWCLRDPRGCAYDPLEKAVYVADHGKNRIMKFKVDGTEATVFWTIQRPLDVCISHDHILVVVQKAVNVFTRDGGLLFRISSYGHGQALLKRCESAQFYLNQIAVLDQGHRSVIVYDQRGKYQRHVSHYTHPGRMVLNEIGRIYVTEWENGKWCVKICDWDGENLSSFHLDEGINGICVDGDGFVCVGGDDGKIFVYNPDHELVCTIDNPSLRWLMRYLQLTEDGRLLITDWSTLDKNQLCLL